MTEERTNVSLLPRGWAKIVLDKYVNIAARIGWRGLKKEEYLLSGSLLIAVKDIRENGSINYDVTDHLSEFRYNESPEIQLKGQDILVSKDGTIGRIGLVEALPQQATVNSSILVVRPCSAISPKFLFYYFKGPKFQEIVRKRITGSTVPHLFQHDIKKFELDIPPSNEQGRIVTRLEELFTRLDAGVDALQKVKVQLKRYRHTVLKYAFEGKLTEEWRKTHKDQIEPATKLLERIREERKKKPGTKCKELPPIDASILPKLPEGWKWVRLRDVSKRIQYGTSEKATADLSGIPVLRMGNIQEGKIVFDDLKYFPWDWPQINEFLLDEGDILFNRTNSAELVGKTAVYEERYPKAVFASYLIRVETYKVAYSPKVLSFFINSFYGRQYISAVVSQQVGQANVNGTKLSVMPIPLLPYQEQIAMQQQIDTCFSVAEKIERTTEQSLKQAEHMRQSILKSAFEGRLVPQDARDEPAERLLERIKKEKAKSKNERTMNRKATKHQQLELFGHVR